MTSASHEASDRDRPSSGRLPFPPILLRRRHADRLIRAKISRKVELANEEIIVRLATLIKTRVAAVMAVRLTQGILVCWRRKPKAFGRASQE